MRVMMGDVHIENITVVPHAYGENKIKCIKEH